MKTKHGRFAFHFIHAATVQSRHVRRALRRKMFQTTCSAKRSRNALLPFAESDFERAITTKALFAHAFRNRTFQKTRTPTFTAYSLRSASLNLPPIASLNRYDELRERVDLVSQNSPDGIAVRSNNPGDITFEITGPGEKYTEDVAGL